WFLTASDPAYYDSFIAKNVQQGRSFDASTDALRASLGGGGKDVDELGAFAAYLFSHNAQIGILSFSLGFALGVPTLALIFTNGLMLGAFLALFSSRGLLVELGGWLSIHGPTEFLALILSAAAGLKIAGAVLFAGREPRLVRLARGGGAKTPGVGLVRGRRAAAGPAGARWSRCRRHHDGRGNALPAGRPA